MNDFSSFVKRSELVDKNLNLSDVDRTLIATNVSLNPYKNSSERELHRYEFVEVIVRLGKNKYVDCGIIDSIHDAFEKLVIDHIIPKNMKVDGL
jgi:hypothetical protein